jgi:hypothetical protein
LFIDGRIGAIFGKKITQGTATLTLSRIAYNTVIFFRHQVVFTKA